MAQTLACKIGIAGSDTYTWDLSRAADPYLEAASQHLSRNYGGLMEHLWIDVEMIPGRADDRPPWPFRFQRIVRVSRGLERLGVPAPSTPDPENVGHFGVRPDFFKIAEMPPQDVPRYLLERVYEESVVLEKKSRRLGGFDAASFRRDLLEHIATLR